MATYRSVDHNPNPHSGFIDAVPVLDAADKDQRIEQLEKTLADMVAKVEQLEININLLLRGAVSAPHQFAISGTML